MGEHLLGSCCCLVTQSCLTLRDPMDCSPPGSSVHGISQTRILEWIAISYSRRSSWPRDRIHVSCVSWIAGGFFTRCAIGEALKSTWRYAEYELIVKEEHGWNLWGSNIQKGRTFPSFQWLRLCLPMQGMQVWSLVGELRSHMPCSQKSQNIKQKQYCNKFNRLLKSPHQKKIL